MKKPIYEDEVTVDMVQKSKGYWIEIKEQSEEHRDLLLGYMNQFKDDVWRRNKLTIMLYNEQNEIEEAEQNIIEHDALIKKLLKIA